MAEKSEVHVLKGYSSNPDEKAAILELYETIFQPDAAITVIFASSTYNLSNLGLFIKEYFGEKVIGCTTAGEITPDGYKNGTVSGFSISGTFEAEPILINQLDELTSEHIDRITRMITDSALRAKKNGYSAFGILLIDGLSMMEEYLTTMLSHGLADIPFAGGSAGDDNRFENTYVYYKGTFGKNAAIYCLCTTNIPFKPFKTQHFISTERRMVITRANPENRLVYEINGNLAAEEYAKQLGLSRNELSFSHFSKYPLLLRFGEQNYIRSIQKINPDGSMKFFCGIEEGLVLRLAARSDIVDNLKYSFYRCCGPDFKTILTIGFDCIHRKMEIDECGKQHEIEDILKQYNTIGFCTYGEQFNSIHVNQTFTGVLLGNFHDR
ncbi:MAG: FIST domain containing protein [Fibrobacter sp.]|nr:FIST domain containing protein [Fibrobacter sp.]